MLRVKTIGAGKIGVWLIVRFDKCYFKGRIKTNYSEKIPSPIKIIVTEMKACKTNITRGEGTNPAPSPVCGARELFPVVVS